MPVIARDTVAADHLVYAWPLPIGPDDYEVSCAEDELVVMCPAWLVGDRLGPGRHRWRTPDPSRPVSAYFVLTAPVEVSFDMITQFIIPATGQAVRLRASGSLQIRCMDPALLVAQFVGLPFDTVNDGVVRSVSRSIERMLARLLTRRVVMAGTPHAVTDPAMLANIVEELVAYNPAAGAVFGIELVRFGHLAIAADDGSRPWQQLVTTDHTRTPTIPPPIASERSTESVTVQQPVVGLPPVAEGGRKKTPPLPMPAVAPPSEVSGEIIPKPKGDAKPPTPGRTGHPTMQTPVVPPPIPSMPSAKVSSAKAPTASGAVSSSTSATASGSVSSSSSSTVSGTLNPNRPMPSPPPRRAAAMEVQSADEPSQPAAAGVRTPPPGSLQAVSGEIGGKKPTGSGSSGSELAEGTPMPKPGAQSESSSAEPAEARGSILGIGMAHIGSSAVVGGEITKKIAPGGRVLVPGPNGLMQSATVRQLLQGYYELEVGGSGETIWVPVSGVVPE